MALLEKGLIKFVPDRFDHFDRNDFIEFALQVTIILQLDFDPVGQSLFLDALGRVIKLLLRNRDRRDPASVILRREDRKTAPTAADFQNMIGLFKPDLSANFLVLLDLGVLKRLLHVLEIRGRVRHGRIKKKLIKIVPQIVMSRNILAAPRDRILAKQGNKIIQRFQEIDRRGSTFGVHQRGMVFEIHDHPCDDVKQIVRMPITFDIGLSKPDIAEQHTFFKKPVIADVDIRRDASLSMAVLENLSVRKMHVQSANRHRTEGEIQ